MASNICILLHFWILGMTYVTDAEVRITLRKSDADKDLDSLSANTTTPKVPVGPYFAADSPSSITAAIGLPVHMPCKARNLGAKSVSWIRHKDLHVLTVGSFTFTNDERFSAHRDPSSGDWVLVLRKPKPKDSGAYECSISTKPVLSHTVKLNVVVPSAEMVGAGSGVYLDKGSTLQLTCLIHFSPAKPEFVLWYHRDKLVTPSKVKGHEVFIITSQKNDETTSILVVNNATLRHSGKYSCKPSNANKVSIIAHVLRIHVASLD